MKKIFALFILAVLAGCGTNPVYYPGYPAHPVPNVPPPFPQAPGIPAQVTPVRPPQPVCPHPSRPEWRDDQWKCVKPRLPMYYSPYGFGWGWVWQGTFIYR